MTDITTAVTDSGVLTSWAIPDEQTGYGGPRGDLVFSGTDVIPALITTNESKWQLTCTVPRGFAWKYASFTCSFTSDDFSDFDDMERGGKMVITMDDQVDERAWFSETRLYNVSVNSNAFDFTDTADVFAQFIIPNPPDYFMYPRLADGTIVFTMMDVTTSATNAMAVRWRMRLLQYTYEQCNSWQAHYPNLILGA